MCQPGADYKSGELLKIVEKERPWLKTLWVTAQPSERCKRSPQPHVAGWTGQGCSKGKPLENKWEPMFFKKKSKMFYNSFIHEKNVHTENGYRTVWTHYTEKENKNEQERSLRRTLQVVTTGITDNVNSVRAYGWAYQFLRRWVIRIKTTTLIPQPRNCRESKNSTTVENIIMTLSTNKKEMD